MNEPIPVYNKKGELAALIEKTNKRYGDEKRGKFLMHIYGKEAATKYIKGERELKAITDRLIS